MIVHEVHEEVHVRDHLVGRQPIVVATQEDQDHAIVVGDQGIEDHDPGIVVDDPEVAIENENGTGIIEGIICSIK